MKQIYENAKVVSREIKSLILLQFNAPILQTLMHVFNFMHMSTTTTAHVNNIKYKCKCL